jgi:hypothetical protein
MFQESFDNFMAGGFESAVESSTRAGWSGAGNFYYVELFRDGSYSVHWSCNVGNLYDSPGLMLAVPQLGQEDWDDDPDLRYYDNAEQEMRDWFAEQVAAYPAAHPRYSDAMI